MLFYKIVYKRKYMRNAKIVYVGFAYGHHMGTHAGYHQIRKYGHYDYIVDIQKYKDACEKGPSNLFDKIIRHINYKLFGTPCTPFYVLRCIWMGITMRNTVFHFIYGENTYYDIFQCFHKSNKIVCTFHQPFSWFVNNKWEKKLKRIDKIILVGNSEIIQFQKITGRDNVIFIPHGISADFYKPDNTVKKKHMLLTVGNWLRDYRFADKVYKALLESDETLEINVVASKENAQKLTSQERIHIHRNISDRELLLLYQESSVLFLPLIRYTANNSLLEAGATGCNIVIASDMPDNSYIPAGMLNLCPMNLEQTLNTINRSLSLNNNIELSEYVKKTYGWETIGKRVDQELRKDF